jgi:hypothetical protein
MEEEKSMVQRQIIALSTTESPRAISMRSDIKTVLLPNQT